MSTERLLAMSTRYAFLLMCLFVLTNSMSLVDLLSKLRRGNPVGGPTNVYDRYPKINTVSFGVPDGYNNAAFQSHLIQNVQPSELKSNFHSVLGQFRASGGTGAQSHTGTRNTARNRHQYSPASGRQYSPVQQAALGRQYTPVHHVSSRQQQLLQTQQKRGGWMASTTSNQSPGARQQLYQGYTQTQGMVPNQSRAPITQTSGYMREQVSVPTYGRAQVSQQSGFTGNLGLVPSPSRIQIPRTSGYTQEQLLLLNRGGQIAQQSGFTQKHTTASSQRGAQPFTRQTGFKQNSIPKASLGVMRQFVTKMKRPVTSGTSFGRVPSNPRYTRPGLRSRQF